MAMPIKMERGTTVWAFSTFSESLILGGEELGLGRFGERVLRVGDICGCGHSLRFTVLVRYTLSALIQDDAPVLRHITCGLVEHKESLNEAACTKGAQV